METQLPSINYDWAHLFLKPEEFMGTDWRVKANEPNFRGNKLEMVVADDFLLNMSSISIPVQNLKNIRTEKDVIQEVRLLLGDCENPLKEYLKLVNEKKVQESLYFSPRGLSDYSMNSFVSKKISEMRKLPKDLSVVLPGRCEVPNGVALEFVPTVIALRELDCIEHKEGDSYLFKGETFADRIKNFLRAYNAVCAHNHWFEQKAREASFEARRTGNENESYSPSLMRLVIKD